MVYLACRPVLEGILARILMGVEGKEVYGIDTYGIWLVMAKEVSRGEISSECGVAGR